jgi:hypothetical protein
MDLIKRSLSANSVGLLEDRRQKETHNPDYNFVKANIIIHFI